MPSSKTESDFYNEIEFLASKIGELNLPEQFIEAAKERDENRIRTIFEKFKREEPQLWKRMSNLYRDYSKAGCPIIFDDEQHMQGYYEYNPEKINPINLCVLYLLSNGIMEECNTFVQYETLQKAVRKAGYTDIANTMSWFAMVSLVDFLMEAFR